MAVVAPADSLADRADEQADVLRRAEDEAEHIRAEANPRVIDAAQHIKAARADRDEIRQRHEQERRALLASAYGPQTAMRHRVGATAKPSTASRTGTPASHRTTSRGQPSPWSTNPQRRCTDRSHPSRARTTTASTRRTRTAAQRADRTRPTPRRPTTRRADTRPVGRRFSCQRLFHSSQQE